jgi:hypothetical protein
VSVEVAMPSHPDRVRRHYEHDTMVALTRADVHDDLDASDEDAAVGDNNACRQKQTDTAFVAGSRRRDTSGGRPTRTTESR